MPLWLLVETLLQIEGVWWWDIWTSLTKNIIIITAVIFLKYFVAHTNLTAYMTATGTESIRRNTKQECPVNMRRSAGQPLLYNSLWWRRLYYACVNSFLSLLICPTANCLSPVGNDSCQFGCATVLLDKSREKCCPYILRGLYFSGEKELTSREDNWYIICRD